MYGKSNMETYIIICKIDSQREFAVWLRKLNRRLSTSKSGMGREMGGRFKRKRIDVYLWLFHVEVWQKTTNFCKAIQFSSVAQSYLTLCNPVNRSMPGFPIHHQLLESTPKPMSIELVMPTNYLILCCPLLLLPQSFPASGSFPMSQLSALGGQSIGVSASTSILPMNTQDWSPLGWTGWISLQSKGLSRVFSITTLQKHQFFSAQLSL